MQNSKYGIQQLIINLIFPEAEQIFNPIRSYSDKEHSIENLLQLQIDLFSDGPRNQSYRVQFQDIPSQFRAGFEEFGYFLIQKMQKRVFDLTNQRDFQNLVQLVEIYQLLNNQQVQKVCKLVSFSYHVRKENCIEDLIWVVPCYWSNLNRMIQDKREFHVQPFDLNQKLILIKEIVLTITKLPTGCHGNLSLENVLIKQDRSIVLSDIDSDILIPENKQAPVEEAEMKKVQKMIIDPKQVEIALKVDLESLGRLTRLLILGDECYDQFEYHEDVEKKFLAVNPNYIDIFKLITKNTETENITQDSLKNFIDVLDIKKDQKVGEILQFYQRKSHQKVWLELDELHSKNISKADFSWIEMKIISLAPFQHFILPSIEIANLNKIDFTEQQIMMMLSKKEIQERLIKHYNLFLVFLGYEIRMPQIQIVDDDSIIRESDKMINQRPEFLKIFELILRSMITMGFQQLARQLKIQINYTLEQRMIDIQLIYAIQSLIKNIKIQGKFTNKVIIQPQIQKHQKEIDQWNHSNENYKFYKRQNNLKLWQWIKEQKQRLKSPIEQEKGFDKLQRKHDFIQWIFPRNNISAFNDYCYPLIESEIQLILVDVDVSSIIEKKFFFFKSILHFFFFFLQVGLEIIQNYDMMLKFYGLQIQDLETGDLVKSPSFKQRGTKTIIENPHNQARILRIIISLNLMGFTHYAKLLKDIMIRQVTTGDLRHGQGSPQRGWQQINFRKIPTHVLFEPQNQQLLSDKMKSLN